MDKGILQVTREVLLDLADQGLSVCLLESSSQSLQICRGSRKDDRAALRKAGRQPDIARLCRSVTLHEHLIGETHTEGRSELMYIALNHVMVYIAVVCPSAL